jgi:hypothetical protein
MSGAFDLDQTPRSQRGAHPASWLILASVAPTALDEQLIY